MELLLFKSIQFSLGPYGNQNNIEFWCFCSCVLLSLFICENWKLEIKHISVLGFGWQQSLPRRSQHEGSYSWGKTCIWSKHSKQWTPAQPLRQKNFVWSSCGIRNKTIIKEKAPSRRLFNYNYFISHFIFMSLYQYCLINQVTRINFEIQWK